MPAKHRLFVYGSLMNGTLLTRAMDESDKTVAHLGTARLYGHWRAIVTIPNPDPGENAQYPTLIPSCCAWVDGDLVEVDSDELMKIDAYEDRYCRCLVQVEDQETWVYLLDPRRSMAMEGKEDQGKEDEEGEEEVD